MSLSNKHAAYGYLDLAALVPGDLEGVDRFVVVRIGTCDPAASVVAKCRSSSDAHKIAAYYDKQDQGVAADLESRHKDQERRDEIRRSAARTNMGVGSNDHSDG